MMGVAVTASRKATMLKVKEIAATIDAIVTAAMSTGSRRSTPRERRWMYYVLLPRTAREKEKTTMAPLASRHLRMYTVSFVCR